MVFVKQINYFKIVPMRVGPNVYVHAAVGELEKMKCLYEYLLMKAKAVNIDTAKVVRQKILYHNLPALQLYIISKSVDAAPDEAQAIFLKGYKND